MSDYHIALPSKPRVVSESERSGTYEIDGLYPGYGFTLGNSLRRIILSSLPGAAVTHVKIPGVSHEFSTIEGVKEDVVTILLNLRKIRFKLLSDEPQTITLSVKGPKEVTAAELKLPGQVEVLNPEQRIADVTGKVNFELEIRAERGLGYIPKEEHQKERVDIGTIALDAIFSPIRRANYEVENMRVGDRTDFNRLRMLIETDGTIAPREALERSIETSVSKKRKLRKCRLHRKLALPVRTKVCRLTPKCSRPASPNSSSHSAWRWHSTMHPFALSVALCANAKTTCSPSKVSAKRVCKTSSARFPTSVSLSVPNK